MGKWTKVFKLTLIVFVVFAFLYWIFGAEDWLLRAISMTIPLSAGFYLGLVEAE